MVLELDITLLREMKVELLFFPIFFLQQVKVFDDCMVECLLLYTKPYFKIEYGEDILDLYYALMGDVFVFPSHISSKKNSASIIHG